MANECGQRIQDCEAVIESCDKAVQAQEKELTLCDLAIKQTLNQKVQLESDVVRYEHELNSWYRNPLVLIPLGFILGGTAVMLTR